MMLSSNLALSQTLIVFTYFDMVGEVPHSDFEKRYQGFLVKDTDALAYLSKKVVARAYKLYNAEHA